MDIGCRLKDCEVREVLKEMLEGRAFEVLDRDDRKEITESALLDPLQGQYGINIPAGQWHTLEVLEKGSVIFEVKDGPYTPLTPENIL